MLRGQHDHQADPTCRLAGSYLGCLSKRGLGIGQLSHTGLHLRENQNVLQFCFASGRVQCCLLKSLADAFRAGRNEHLEVANLAGRIGASRAPESLQKLRRFGMLIGREQ
jgi:hypothetical protein